MKEFLRIGTLVYYPIISLTHSFYWHIVLLAHYLLAHYF